jgi:superfamily II DNA/RNA helicase
VRAHLIPGNHRFSINVVYFSGQLLALIKSTILNLKNVKHFVLNKCDRMLDLLGKFLEPFGRTH